MKLLDMHCDTFWLMMRDDSICLEKNELCIDAQKLKKANSMAQFFASFVNLGDFQGENAIEDSYQFAKKMIAHGKTEIDKNDIAIVYNYVDLLENQKQKKISAVLTLEEGGVVNGKMEYLEELYQQGIRLITLTWNHENCIGFPNSRDEKEMQKGLKPFGIEVVERMNELGMIIDVSHLSDGGFWDVIRCSKKPFVASHSNARMLCNHPRNLADDMIKAIAQSGGAVGVNFYPYFLNENGRATVEDIANHAWHMYDVGGEDVVAIGTDFDGFDEGTLDIANISEMNYVFEAFLKRGFTERQLDKIQNKNILRVMREQEG